MDQLLQELKNLQSDCCVTVILNTHRTRPENAQDPILLKNLLKETEERLLAAMDKRSAAPILDRLERLSADINHQENLESLALFANAELARYVRLPVPVEDRVVIDGTFATRDLVRAMHARQGYHVLVLSRKVARLIEAFADRPVEEIAGDFPMDYGNLYTTDREERTRAQGSDNLVEEFFNRVDKAFQKVWQRRPLPLVLVTEERNVAHFRKVTDHDRIIAIAPPVHDEEKAGKIIARAWEAAKPAFEEGNAARIEELRKAVAGQSFLSDLNDIWRALHEGRGGTLFVQHGYFQPARVEGGQLIPLENVETSIDGFLDDAIDEMIEIIMQRGGDVVFVDGDDLADFQGLALVTRW